MYKITKFACRALVYVGAIGFGMFVAGSIIYGTQPFIVLGAVEAACLSLLAEVCFRCMVAQNEKGAFDAV